MTTFSREWELSISLVKDANSRPRSPINATTTTSASVLFVIIERRTDLPTPEPATIPTLCPLPKVNRALMFLIPTSKTSFMGFLSKGFTLLPFRLFLSNSVNLPRLSNGFPKPSITLPSSASPTPTFCWVSVKKTLSPTRISKLDS